ncbi:SusC/RagA family TonB-linked outer membrane protein [Sphingobacterium kyonggiense]
MRITKLLFLMIGIFAFHWVQAQDRVITGKVMSLSDSTLLIGATVSIPTTNIATATDANGNFRISVPSKFKSLNFVMVGYNNQVIDISNKTYLEIYLTSKEEMIEDVVVTAFNTKVKKTDLIGSVTTVNTKDLKVPSNNLTTALAGRVAGMIAYQTSGEPGNDNASFFIRGVSSFGAGKVDPLILIDNMEVTTNDLARLQPQDIESFSILKDATSTAVYGARGANGVILVSTKSGKVGRAKLSINSETSLSSPTKVVEVADPITYMRLHNEAIMTRDPKASVLYSEDKIRNTMAGSDPILYPLTDWMDMIMKKRAVTNRNNININGGNSLALYYVSATFNKDNGLFKNNGKSNYNSNINLSTYQLKSNININLTNSTELVVRLGGTFDEYTGPVPVGSLAYSYATKANPVLFPAYYENVQGFEYVKHTMYGNFEDISTYLNPYAEISKGYRESSTSNMFAQLELNQNLDKWIKGLRFRGMMNTGRYSYMDVSRQIKPYFYAAAGINPQTGFPTVKLLNETSGTEFLNYVAGGRNIRNNIYGEAMLFYNRLFAEKHQVTANLYNTIRHQINTITSDDPNTALQKSLPMRNIGYAGKFGYGYDSRYLMEFNFGYNGTERFAKKNRFGFFPSFGVAWTASNEKFFPFKDFFSTFRVRSTYGLIGNDQIGAADARFFYLSDVSLYDTDRRVYFGMNRDNGIAGISINRYANEDITWETSRKFNLALDFTIKNRLEFTGEYFTERRSNILQSRADIPITMGLGGIEQYASIGEAENKGFDANITWNLRIKPEWSARIMGNFTYARGKYLKYEQIDYGLDYLLYAGKPISALRGYLADRLFISDEEVANSPTQNIGGTVRAGDIKYLDVNNDGIINSRDRVPMGYPTVPEIIYGFGFSTSYKFIDFSMFFQGSARNSFMINYTTGTLQDNYAGVHPFTQVNFPGAGVGNNQLLKMFAESHWSEDNQDLYAIAPRFSQDPIANNTAASSWWLRNGDFLRLKQMELGVTLPQKWLNRYKVASLRFYATMTNPYIWSKFKEWDVEQKGYGLNYPIQRVTNFGLNLNF